MVFQYILDVSQLVLLDADVVEPARIEPTTPGCRRSCAARSAEYAAIFVESMLLKASSQAESSAGRAVRDRNRRGLLRDDLPCERASGAMIARVAATRANRFM
jgi:hypothetical protein